MSYSQRRKAIRLRLFFILVGSGVALGGTARHLWATESLNEDQALDAPKELAIASDHAPGHLSKSAAEVAREVLRLQQQMGGSIVRDRPQLQNLPTQHYQHHNDRLPHDTSLLAWPAARGMATDRPSVPPRRTQDLSLQTKVAQLREIALLLDTQAHRLEELDLYEQADALRDVATRLRHDARRMRQGMLAEDLPK